MNSTYNEEKSFAGEKFIRTLKNKKTKSIWLQDQKMYILIN